MSDKVYDLNQLEQLAGGSQEFVMSMVETFLEHTPGQLADMEQAFEGGDLQAMGGFAHKIKPNIDLFGITSIKEEIRAIENKGKVGQNDADLKAEVNKVSEVLKTAFEQMKAL